MKTIPVSSGLNLLLGLILFVYLAAFSPCSFAEQEIGEFKRIDGTVVQVMEEEYGSISFVGYECWFEMPDGKRIDVPQHGGGSEGGCLISTKGNRAEIYIYPLLKGRFPVATRVLQFDGYQFIDVTTPTKRWFSPLVHTGHYFVGYLVSIAIFSPFIFLGSALIRRTPAQGWWLVLRAVLIILGVFIALVYGIFATLYGPYSPLIFLILVAAGVPLYRMIRNLLGIVVMLSKAHSRKLLGW